WLLPLFSSQPCSPRDLPSCPTRRSSDLGPPSKGNAMQQPSDARRLIPALPAALAFTLGLAGCTIDRLSEPGQTADEQLLISTAIDHGIDRLNPNIPAGTKVFVDGQFFDNAPGDAALYSKYALGSVRDLLLRRGARLVNDR